MSRVLACVFALGVVASTGCATGHKGVLWEAEESSADVERVDLPLPVRLGVRLYPGEHSGFHQLVLQALERDPNFELVQQTYRESQEGDLDYSVELNYEVDASARLVNFVTCFPGFLIMAPWWAGLRWELEVDASARLLRPGDVPIDVLERSDTFTLTYTESTYSIACNVGFAGIVFWPAAGAPLVVGCITAFHYGQAYAYRTRFFSSRGGRAWAQRVADTLAARIDRDLGTRSARRRKPVGEPAPRSEVKSVERPQAEALQAQPSPSEAR